MRKLLSTVLLSSLFLFACNETHDPTDDAGPMEDSAVMCLPCDDAVQLRIEGISDPTAVSIDGVDGLECEDAGTFIYCGIRALPAGEYTMTVSAPGYVPEMIFFSLGEPIGGGPCPCQAPFSRLLMLDPMP